MKKTFISIGESLHASIPKTGEIMKQLSETGANSDTLVTGKYGIRFHITDVGENVEIITEDGFTIITESGETIITE